jgi:hypothetical protein
MRSSIETSRLIPLFSLKVEPWESNLGIARKRDELFAWILRDSGCRTSIQGIFSVSMIWSRWAWVNIPTRSTLRNQAKVRCVFLHSITKTGPASFHTGNKVCGQRIIGRLTYLYKDCVVSRRNQCWLWYCAFNRVRRESVKMTRAGLFFGPGLIRGYHDSSFLGDESFGLSEKPWTAS